MDPVVYDCTKVMNHKKNAVLADNVVVNLEHERVNMM